MAQTNEEILLKKIATTIKELRLQNGLTQSEVYHDLGIHIGRIESYKINITISSLKILCDYFEITMEEFFKRASI